MRSQDEWFLDGTEEEDHAHASRRAFLAGSLKLAGGSALALAVASAPGVRHLALADSHEQAQDDGGQDGGGQDGGGQDGGGGQDDGGQDGGGQDGGGRGGGRDGDMPRVGIGTTAGSSGSNVAGLIGVAAAAAAGAAVLTHRRARAEEASDA